MYFRLNLLKILILIPLGLKSKFSKDFNENTFNEIKELKKLQKIN